MNRLRQAYFEANREAEAKYKESCRVNSVTFAAARDKLIQGVKDRAAEFGVKVEVYFYQNEYYSLYIDVYPEEKMPTKEEAVAFGVALGLEDASMSNEWDHVHYIQDIQLN